jgi:hypothetical protein
MRTARRMPDHTRQQMPTLETTTSARYICGMSEFIHFAHTFLLVFGQLALGGIFALSVPGFHAIERGFFKSTACVYLGCGLAITLGKGYLVFFVQPDGVSRMQGLEVSLWLLFCCGCGLYVYTLWSEQFVLRARAYVGTLFAGLVALSLSASGYRLTPFLSVETLLYPVSFLTSALLLGAVTTALSLGHWYLIELGLSLDPFKRLFKFYLGALIVHLSVLLLGMGLLLIAGGSATVVSLSSLWTDHQVLLWLRLGLGPLASLALAYMIWQTLQIPQTMAATGLFYIAILTVMVGEFLGRFILFRTTLPL